MSWQITKSDIPYLALGAKVLACGGGGETKTIQSLLLSIMQEDDFIPVKSISDLEDGWIAAVGIMGSTVLFGENIPSGDEGIQVLRLYESHFGKTVDALISIEIGGVNALTPLVSALQSNLPVIDGDGMGRAFPELTMTAFYLANIPLAPMVMQTHDSHTIIPETPNSHEAAESAKHFTVHHGGHSHFLCYCAEGKKMTTSMLPGTLKLIRRIGNAILSESHKDEKIENLLAVFANSIYGKPVQIISGVISEVNRWFEHEALVGQFIVDGVSSFANNRVEIEFKNEFVSIKVDVFICTTPDLILVLNEENLHPYGVPEIQVGLSVVIFAVPAPNVLRSKEMLELAGPESFQLEIPYTPLEGKAP